MMGHNSMSNTTHGDRSPTPPVSRQYRLRAQNLARPQASPVNVSHEAEWISWIGVGVGVGVAGILIAAPDGAALIWRRSITTVRTALRRGQSVTATAAVAMAKATIGAPGVGPQGLGTGRR